MRVTQEQANAISRHLARLCKDVVFHTPVREWQKKIVFVDLIEKDKTTDWGFDDPSKIDVEMIVYLIAPRPGDQIEIYERQVTPRKKGGFYTITEVIDRTADGFGYICALMENK